MRGDALGQEVDETAVAAFGGKLAAVLRAGDVIALSGQLGAGKTTLARAVLAGLGLQGEAPSPTFAIVQPYAPPETALAVAHVDLYRIGRPEDVQELGLDDYLADGALLIEWPERLGAALWQAALRIELAPGSSPGTRRLTVIVPEAWKDRWPPT